MAKVTLRDVAEAAGVSIATASWAVNDNRDVRITESTRRKVRRAADELGYHHNALARGLARGCSDIIGFISDGVATSPFAGQVIQGAQDEAWRNGKILLVVDTDGRKDVERRTFSFMFEHQVEGIIGLEADDGRPETSPPPRRGVQTADRAVVRERQAIPGDQGRARHRAIDPAAPGTGHPRQRLRPGGTSRSSRGGATGGWRWRWTFQNKRRRYSHEGRRDTGQRRPLPDIGAMRDTGRSPLRLLLDGRASRDGACGSDRRRRARGPARRPRTPRRQEDQGRPGKEGRHRVQETHRRHHARTGHDGRVRARTVRTAQDAGRRGRAREPAGPAGSTATPRTRVRRATRRT